MTQAAVSLTWSVDVEVVPPFVFYAFFLSDCDQKVSDARRSENEFLSFSFPKCTVVMGLGKSFIMLKTIKQP